MFKIISRSYKIKQRFKNRSTVHTEYACDMTLADFVDTNIFSIDGVTRGFSATADFFCCDRNT